MIKAACTFALTLALGVAAPVPQTVATKGAAQSSAPSSAMQVLLRKASALEARGRLDLAAQTWNQVLITDPNQPDALAGLARWAQQSGQDAKARGYLEKLKVSGRPTAAPVPKFIATGRLAEAGKLAANKQYAEALKIYREVLGEEPPPGPATIAYYETMAAAPEGWKPATLGLQKMTQRFPEAQEYKLALGRLYTYQAQTRGVGIKMLEPLPGDAARAALRQALIWDGPKPANRASIQAYISKVPDAELQRLLTETPKSVPVAGPAMSAGETKGYELLNAGKLDEAQAKLEEVLQTSPRSVVAMAGLGYVAMKREDFAGAAEYFEVASAAAPNDKHVKTALESAQFFLHVQNGTRALNAGETARAKTEFQEAVALRPNDLIALRGLAGAQLKLGERAATLPLFERLTKTESGNVEHWRGLFEARLAKDGAKAAIAAFHKFPAPMQKAMLASVGFQLELASAHFDAGDKTDAAKTVAQVTAAVKKDANALGVDERLQLAGLELALERAAESEELYRDVTQRKSDSVVAWEGLLSAMLKQNKEQEAFTALLSMPGATYQEGLKRNGFLRAAALLQAKYGKPGTADELLKMVLASPTQGAEREGALMLLASTALARGDAKQADEVASQLVEANPQNLDGWKMLISAKQQLKLSADAMEASKRIPTLIATKLQEDPDFIALMAAVEDSAGDTDAAMRSVRSAMERFDALHKPQPAGLQIQLGWLLLNGGGDEKELYSTLTSLRMRKDLTPEQTKGYQEIWSVWIRRRAEKTRKDGDNKTQVAILDAGTKLLPKDGKIRQALAGALLDAGEPRRALAVYRGLLNGTPSAEDFAGAVGTAMRINDPVAQLWLKVGLQRFPHEPALLELAGRDAASKGEYSRAQLMWREALSVHDTQSQKKDGALPLNDPQRAVGSILLGQDLTSGTGTPGRDVVDREAPGTFGLFPFIDQKKPKALEEQVRDELSALDGRNAPYLGAGPVVDARGGTAGFDKRTLVEGDVEASTVLGHAVRVGMTVRPVTINAGASDGTSTLRLGMAPAGVSFAQQEANGLGGDVEISTQSFGVWGGVSPRGFAVENYIGGLRFRPGNGPVTLTVSREPVKDTLLSYAGTKDPVSGQTFGGVIANTGNVRADFGNESAGYYFGGGYQQLKGLNVEDNTRYDGLVGGYRQVTKLPQGSLNVGLFAFGMHYEHNLRFFTFGHGGYFSPQRYFLVGVPVTWRGVWNRRLEYSISGAVGPQSFREDASAYFPTMPLLQGRDGPYYPALSSTGLNYNMEFKWLYQFNPNWFLGGLLNINNARNYTAQSLSFFLRYSPKARTLGSDYWLPSVPDWKGKQPFHLD